MKTRLVTPPGGVEEVVRILRAGEVVGLPTETVYGLGADALNPLACARIFEAKERPFFDPLIVHVPDPEWMDRLARPVALARRLVEAFWPGPLTLVLPRREVVPDLVTSGQETVALRMSAHPVFQTVAREFGRPIAAPSANRFGRISPTTADHVVAELEGRIPLVLDGGPCPFGIESTIVLLSDQNLSILRHGPVTAGQLADFAEVKAPDPTVAAPGNLKSHYAPRTPLEILETPGLMPESLKHTGLLAWSHSGAGFAAVEHLSRSGDLCEAAANLYGAMRRLDEGGLQKILAEPVPETGLGVAIMERLRKAAARE